MTHSILDTYTPWALPATRRQHDALASSTLETHCSLAAYETTMASLPSSVPSTPDGSLSLKKPPTTGVLHRLRKKLRHPPFITSKTNLVNLSITNNSSDRSIPAHATDGSGSPSFRAVASPAIAPDYPKQGEAPRPPNADVFPSGVSPPSPPPAALAVDTVDKDDASAAVSFAVDVSGSTQGRIIRQEQAAIEALTMALIGAGRLSMEASAILPWDDSAHGVMQLTQTKQLVSGAGTTPWVVLKDERCRRQLQKSKLWFLMTDGCIQEDHVRKFANLVPQVGLHGTACVIITFGFSSQSPFHCNVSVGMSVFAVAPHCLFLFRDVQSGALLVFQAKGCFANLLPPQKQFMVFDMHTRWDDLHHISLEQIASIDIPGPTKLAQDVVLLPNGKQFDMAAIYEDRVSPDVKMELLADYAALDVIILAAQTRGTSDAVKRWIERSRRKESAGPLLLQRDDVDGSGVQALLAIIDSVMGNNSSANQEVSDDNEPDTLWEKLAASGSTPPGFSHTAEDRILRESLKHALRSKHGQNWASFQNKVRIEADLSSKMTQVFDEVLSTMTNYNGPVPSPALLTPMSSPEYNDSNRYQARDSSRRKSPLGHTQSEYKYRGPSPLPSASAPLAHLNFLAGFIGRGSHHGYGLPDSYDSCSVCGSPSTLQCLLLRRSPNETETPGLPSTNRQAKHKYPLVLGNYPETDTVLPLVACHACAFLFLKAGDLPRGAGRVSAALPLVDLKQSKTNRDLWLSILDDMYGHRFHECIVPVVFLSTLCSTLEYLAESEGPPESDISRPLEWCCRQLSFLSGVSTMAGLTPVGSPLASVVDDSMPLDTMLRFAFSLSNSLHTDSLLLSYPIDGFVAVVRLASLNKDIEFHAIELFIWKRLSYYFLEKHVALQEELGSKEANAQLTTLLLDSDPSREDQSGPEKRIGFTIDELSNTYLLPKNTEILSQFRRMGQHFSAIETTGKFVFALASFLHLLRSQMVSIDNEGLLLDVDELYVELRQKAEGLSLGERGLYDVFEDPKLVNEGVAQRFAAICG